MGTEHSVNNLFTLQPLSIDFHSHHALTSTTSPKGLQLVLVAAQTFQIKQWNKICDIGLPCLFVHYVSCIHVTYCIYLFGGGKELSIFCKILIDKTSISWLFAGHIDGTVYWILFTHLWMYIHHVCLYMQPVLIPRGSNTNALPHPSASHADAQGILQCLYDAHQAFN